MTTGKETTKLTPFAGTDEVAIKTESLGCQRNFLLEAEHEHCRYLWHLPNRNAPVGSPKKNLVWPNGDTAASAHSFAAGKVTGPGRFANRQDHDIIARQAKLSFFSRYLRIHSDRMRCRFSGWTTSDRV
jgi:hypothetical protein